MSRLAAALLGALALAVCPVPAEEGVRVYTNADLERLFSPAPQSPNATPRMDDEDWAEVLAFIERQYEQLDARRSYELDRAILERREREGRDVNTPDRRPYYGTILYGRQRPYRVPGVRSGIGRNVHRAKTLPDEDESAAPPPVEPAPPPRVIVPLHARRPLR